VSGERQRMYRGVGIAAAPAGSLRLRTAVVLALGVAMGDLSGGRLSRAGGAWAAAAPPPQGDGPTATSELQLDAAERARFQRPAEDADSLAAAPPAGAAATPAASPWAGTLELYGFLPLKTSNRTTIQGFTAEADLSLGQLLEALTSTVSLRGSVEHGRLGLLTDISYVNLQKQAAIERTRDRFRIGDGRLLSGLDAYRERSSEEGRADRRSRLRGRAAERRANLGEVDRQRGELAARLASRERGSGSVTRSFRTELGTEQGIYDVALRYRLGARESAVADPGTVTVIPYAGIRILDVGLSIDSLLSSSRGRQKAIARAYGSPVVQPLLGTQAQVFVAPRLRLFARGDAAGFGISGADSFSANAQVGLGYAVGNSTQIDLSWRYLHMAADNGRQPPNAYVVGENGIELGLKFFF
jgi:hypothetical protein